MYKGFRNLLVSKRRLELLVPLKTVPFIFISERKGLIDSERDYCHFWRYNTDGYSVRCKKARF